MRAKPLWPPTLLYGLLIAMAIIFLRSHWTLPWRFILLFLTGGWFFWTFVEYVFHRFVLHHPRAPKIFEAWHEHAPHHENPNDPEKMVYSLGESFFFFTAAFFLFWGLTQNLATALGLAAGFMLGYLFYEFTHWGSHFWNRQTALGRWLFANHWRHHFDNPKRCFGFSTRLWDWLFRTR